MYQTMTMTGTNPGEAYRRQNIMTASPLELIVMLYDGIKKNITLAQKAIKRRDVSAAHDKLIKAQAIVNELMGSLDLSISMSGDLMKLYEFMLHELGQANIKKDADRLDSVLEIVGELREAWQEICDSQRVKNQSMYFEDQAI